MNSLKSFLIQQLDPKMTSSFYNVTNTHLKLKDIPSILRQRDTIKHFTLTYSSDVFATESHYPRFFGGLKAKRLTDRLHNLALSLGMRSRSCPIMQAMNHPDKGC